MRFRTSLPAIAAIAAIAAVPATAGASAPPAGSAAPDAAAVDCAEIAANFDDSTQLTHFLNAISLLPESMLESLDDQPVTVLAPLDAAFEQMPANVIESLLADQSMIVSLVGHHLILDGQLTAADLVAAGTATAADGEELTFADDGGTVSINGGEATIVCPDITTNDDDDEQLTVQVIDSVLRPASMTGAPGGSTPGSSSPGSSVPGASFDAEQQLIATTWETVVDSSSTFDDVAELIDDADDLRATIDAYPAAADVVGGITARVTQVTIEGDTATIAYVVEFAGVEAPYGELPARLVRNDDGGWEVPRDEFCAVMAYARNDCPA